MLKEYMEQYTPDPYTHRTIAQWLPILVQVSTGATLQELSSINRIKNRLDAKTFHNFYQRAKTHLEENSRNALAGFVTLLELAIFRDTGRTHTANELANTITQIQDWYVNQHMHSTLGLMARDVNRSRPKERILSEVRSLIQLTRELLQSPLGRSKLGGSTG
jgi:hypothetical protein